MATYIKAVDSLMTETNRLIQTLAENTEDTGPEKDALYAAFMLQYDLLNHDAFSSNKNNIFGAAVLWSWSAQLSPEKMDSLYAEAGNIIREFPPIVRRIEKNKKFRSTAEENQFIDFTIANGNFDGSTASLSDHIGKGKYILVDFWASWCVPCIKELPTLKDIYNKFHGEKFDILGVAVWDKREDSINAIEKHEKSWPHILDANTIPTDIYGIDAIPHTILFGPDGEILARGLSGKHLKEMIERILNDPK